MIRICKDISDPLDSGVITAARYLLKYEYQIGQGLGMLGQGDLRPTFLLIKGQIDKSGLGYQEDQPDNEARSLYYCHRHGFPHILQLFIHLTGGTLEKEQLLDKFKDIEVHTIEEASDSSKANAVLEG